MLGRSGHGLSLLGGSFRKGVRVVGVVEMLEPSGVVGLLGVTGQFSREGSVKPVLFLGKAIGGEMEGSQICFGS